MVNINSTVEIHDGVSLVLCRHDDARGQNISGVGAAWAYALGKFMGDIFLIDSPEYIIHSPIARARNTAKMHQIGMKVNNISNPRMQYDARLHEKATLQASKEAVIDAINGLSFYGIKTLEVVTHSNTPVSLAREFGAKCGNINLGYGGIIVLYADTWKDMLDGKNVRYDYYNNSKDAVTTIIGREQTDILECIFAFGTSREKGIYDVFPDVARDVARGSILNKKEEETKKWLQDIKDGKDVETIVPPIEFLEIYDAYRYWIQNMALSVGITPEENTPLYSKLAEQLLGPSFQTFSERFLINEDEYDGRDPAADGMGYAYPIWNAAAKKLEAKHGISMSAREAGNQVVADILEDFPGYRDSMLVGQGRRLGNNDEEVEVTDGNPASYYVKDGDDGDGHPMLNAVVWKHLKDKEND